MNLRRGSFAILVAAPLMLAGCAVESDDHDDPVDSTESALDVDCDLLDVCADDDVAPRAQVATLASFDESSGALTYVAGGKTVTSVVTSSTRARIAPINKYPPHPIVPLVSRWNALVRQPGPARFGNFQGSPDVDAVTFRGLTSSLASAGARMKVKLNKNGSVKALRPVP